jgi:transketolase
MRNELAQALVEYGKVNQDVVVLDADVANSTMTIDFQKVYPDRFFNVGIAEAGMIDTAVGLAMGGKIPFVSAFAAMLCYRGMEQIRSCIAYNNANVKLLASFAGVSDYKDGATHHSLIDIVLMRALQNMTVIVAADGGELKKMIPAIAEYPGPVYLRLSRADTPYTFKEDDPFQIGRGRLACEGKDVTIIVTGTPLHRCIAARDILKKKGISARVVEIHTIKPLDEDLVIRCAKETKALVTVEEHSVIGGLYGAIAELLVKSNTIIPVAPVGIKDIFAKTAPDPETLWDFCGFTPENIVSASVEVIDKKS